MPTRAACQRRMLGSTLRLNHRLEGSSGYWSARNAHIEIGIAAVFHELRENLGRHRELQPKRPEIAEPKLEARGEDEGQVVLAEADEEDPLRETRPLCAAECPHRPDRGPVGEGGAGLRVGRTAQPDPRQRASRAE